MAAVEFQDVDIMFGAAPSAIAEATKQRDGGATREEILAATGVVVGVSRASLKIRAGEICVLMGLSGSGKSTLLRAVNGLNKVTRGRVLVADGGRQVDVAACDAKTLRHMRTRRIAMVFQQFALLPWRTVRENVGLGLELRGVKPAERRLIVDEKLKLVALDKWADKYASELSGGMQQRVGLARAFATDADILLMDEPFSALDPLIRTRLQDELLDLQRNLKKTIIFVSHDLDEALKLGNQIAILEGGRIVQAGTPEDIVLRPADDYVREFVRHMNPLNILRAGGHATPVGTLPRIGDHHVLDGPRRLHLRLDETGRAQAASLAGQSCPLWRPDGGVAPPGVLALVPPDLLLREVIEVRNATGLPVAVEVAGCVTGLCREDDLFGALAGDGWRA